MVYIVVCIMSISRVESEKGLLVLLYLYTLRPFLLSNLDIYGKNGQHRIQL